MSATPPEPDQRAAADPAREHRRSTAREPVYLRTVYALNPGIPHFVDVPRGRD